MRRSYIPRPFISCFYHYLGDIGRYNCNLYEWTPWKFCQYRLNLMAFCKDFNARTQKYKPDTPMAVSFTAFKDNTFEFTVKSPSVTWYLKKAAGIESGCSRPGHVTASTLSLRHVYEVAKVKQSDPYLQNMSLESISKSIIGTANSMGIKVVKDLD